MTRLSHALSSARIRLMPGKDRTQLTTEALDDICKELLAAHNPQLLELLERLQREHDARMESSCT